MIRVKMHTIELSGYSARLAGGGQLVLGTAGSHGNEQLCVVLGEGWQGLTVHMIFHPAEVDIYLPSNGVADVPWEATEKPLPSGRIVFQGIAEGRLINSTDLGYMVAAHSPTAGEEEKPYTPGVIEGFVTEVRSDAAAAKNAAGQAKQSAESAAASAGEAKASETAAAGSAAAAAKSAGDAAAALKDTQQAGSDAQQALNEAKTDALSALDEKQQAAADELENARKGAVQDVAKAGETAASAIREEGEKQIQTLTATAKQSLTALDKAGQAAVNAVTQEGSAQTKAVRQEGDTQISAITKAGQAQQQEVKNAGADALSKIDTANAHSPIIQDGTWWTWDATSGAYTDTGSPAESQTLYATFDLDPATGLLSMTTPDGYAGPEFALNNGHLEVHINAED